MRKNGSGWKPNHLKFVFSHWKTNFTSPHGTTLMAFADVKYGCLKMLDGLVSTHPKTVPKRAYGIGPWMTPWKNPRDPQSKETVLPSQSLFILVVLRQLLLLLRQL